MRETTLAEVGFEGFASAFNRVYEGYAVPVAVDAAWAERYARDHDLDLAASPLWLDDAGGPVGLAALGVRGDRGWVGGFGLAPSHRGRGIGRALLTAAVDAARRRGLRQVQLEVLAENAPAIALYERGGFRRTRVLRILAGDAIEPGQPGAGSTAIEAPRAIVLGGFDRLHPAPMPWQREAASFARLEGVRSFVSGSDDAPVASALWVEAEHAAPRLLDVGVAGREDDAAPAVAAVLAGMGTASGQGLRLLNEPEGSPADRALARLGWRETGRQFEMVIDLDR